MYKDHGDLVKKFWMGADPGGKGNFGLAFLDTTGKFEVRYGFLRG